MFMASVPAVISTISTFVEVEPAEVYLKSPAYEESSGLKIVYEVRNIINGPVLQSVAVF
ncbi:1686_t:CDS:2 [Funneliformis caledonium]|uniref:1686_t:CDS:1 n=1 Tax=Funneliformis caledonium TaxID=1117310 RepID=A0A9N9BP55_9GLOM|nr:1686_t:CDS:2 [Funneliformis caledonium]